MRQLKDLGLIIAYELHGFRYYSLFCNEFKMKYYIEQNIAAAARRVDIKDNTCYLG